MVHLIVSGNIIGAPKIRNNFHALKFYFFSHSIAMLDFSHLLSFLYFPFYSYRSSNYCDSINSCHSFSPLKAIAIGFSFLFAIAFKSKKELYGRQLKKCPILLTIQRNKAKRLIVTNVVIAKSQEGKLKRKDKYCYRNIGKIYKKKYFAF